jgi:hypothetical protein
MRNSPDNMTHYDAYEMGNRGPFPGGRVKWQGCEADHSPSIANTKKSESTPPLPHVCIA